MKKEISPVALVVAVVVVLGILAFAWTRLNPPPPKKSNAELRQHKPTPKIPPMEAAPPG